MRASALAQKCLRVLWLVDCLSFFFCVAPAVYHRMSVFWSFDCTHVRPLLKRDARPKRQQNVRFVRVDRSSADELAGSATSSARTCSPGVIGLPFGRLCPSADSCFEHSSISSFHRRRGRIAPIMVWLSWHDPRLVAYSIVLALLSWSSSVKAAHIGLFASTGCYSHDTVMRHFADRLTSIGHRVTLIQIRVYEFNRTSASATIRQWQHLSYDACGNESMSTLRRIQRQMWTTLVPIDSNSWNMEGVRILTQLHKHHIRACFNALRDLKFMENVRTLRLDLLVTDYILNECALRFSNILDVNLAYFSNYPVLSSYAADLGIPSNPSYVPSVIGYETTKMQVRQRLFNSLLYFILWSTRQFFDFDANQTFRRALGRRVYKKAKSKSGNRSVLTFATPFEFMVDVPRPMARNLHYFGCDHCFGIAKEPAQRISEILNISTPGDGVILVSFGTVTKGDQIPVVQLQRLIRTFARFPSYTFVWQLDLTRNDFVQRVLKPAGLLMPSNVHVFPWLPMKRLLVDPDLVLLINHGGISTCFEALHREVPILGIALQGDQGYNLRRFVDRGIAEMFAISDLTDEVAYEKLSHMIKNIQKYRSAARKLRGMVYDFVQLHRQSPSLFWVDWTARHFGRGQNASSAALKAKRFLTLPYPSNWFVYYSLDVLAAIAISVGLCARIVWVTFVLSMRSHLSKRVKL